MARYVTISSLTFKPEEDREKNLVAAMAMVDQAALGKPDLIVLPEVFRESPNCFSHDPREIAEPVDGGATVSAVAAKARQHSCYFAFSMIEKLGGKIYNAAVLIDRKGAVAGKYHKYYPTIGEIEKGISPGQTLPAFNTDFGRVGMAVCYDLNFWDVGEGLAHAGAEIILFPSQYRGGMQLIAWAYRLGCFMVSSTPEEHSRIIDPMGRVIGDSSMYEPIVTRRINLDCVVAHIDYNKPRVEAAQRKMGPSLEVVVGSPEGLYMLINHDPTTTIQQIIKEYEIEPLSDYYARARRARSAALA